MTVSAEGHQEATALSDEHQAWEAAEARYGTVVHECPPDDNAVMPCCGQTPFEVPRWHRVTLDVSAVTCKGTDSPIGPESAAPKGVEMSDSDRSYDLGEATTVTEFWPLP